MRLESAPSFLLVLPVLGSPIAAQAWLDAPLRPPEAQSGEFRALGDFEGDGDVDVLWYEGGGVSWTGFRIFLNDGSGGYAPGPLAAFAGSGRRAVYGELRDVTGDGFADVVANVSAAPRMVEVYPGAAGATFGAPLSFVTPLVGYAEDYAWGDMDGDGVAEIATWERTPFQNDGEFRWWDFSGGTFVPSAPVAISAPGVADAIAMDLNGDGLDDLVAGEQSGDELLLLPSVAGAPTLGGRVELGLPGSCAIYPLAGDLEGDGDLDLVASCTCSLGPSLVPVVRGAAGAFTPLAAQALEGWSWADHGRPGAAADWDGDGDLDVLSHNGNISSGAQRGTLTLLENDGGHAFHPAAEITTEFKAPRAAVGTADLDGDGRPDFAAVHSLVFGSGRFEDVLSRFAFPVFPAPDDPGAALDWEDDGDLDIYRKGTGASGGALFVNDGRARFSARSVTPAPPPEHLWGEAEAIADFSGDGRPDLLVRLTTEGEIPLEPPEFVEMRLLVDDGLGGFSDGGVAIPGGDEALGDSQGLLLEVDVDGDLDLLDHHPLAAGEPGGAWINAGAGAFTGFQSLFAGEPLGAGDVDADGDLDVLTHEAVGPGLLALERQAPSGFLDELVYSGNLDKRTLRLADLDLDGDEDLAFTRTSIPQGISVRANAGGSFTEAALVPVSVTAKEWIGVGTVDGDDIPDLVVGIGTVSFGGGGNATHMQVVRGLGGLAFEAPRTFAGLRMAGVGDLDGDGDSDLFGETVSTSRRFDGPEDGRVRQRGSGTPGAGGAVPVLGAFGPLRPGSTGAELRLRRGVGGGHGWLEVDVGPSSGPAHLRGSFVLPISLTGTPGEPGAGTYDRDLGPFLGLFAGWTWKVRAMIADPAAPSGVAKTNRLELAFGL